MTSRVLSTVTGWCGRTGQHAVPPVEQELYTEPGYVRARTTTESTVWGKTMIMHCVSWMIVYHKRASRSTYYLTITRICDMAWIWIVYLMHTAFTVILSICMGHKSQTLSFIYFILNKSKICMFNMNRGWLLWCRIEHNIINSEYLWYHTPINYLNKHCTFLDNYSKNVSKYILCYVYFNTYVWVWVAWFPGVARGMSAFCFHDSFIRSFRGLLWKQQILLFTVHISS